MNFEASSLHDTNLFFLAKTILNRTKRRKIFWTSEDISRLKSWPWLRIKLNNVQVEKLIRFIYYFSKKQQGTRKKSLLDLEPKELEIKVLTPEETHKHRDAEMKKALNTGIPEKYLP